MSERPKRPYQRPTLEGASVFGAEALSGSCCRSSTSTCSNAARDTQRITTDANKVRTSTAS